MALMRGRLTALVQSVRRLRDTQTVEGGVAFLTYQPVRDA
jgi:hypothetical protein